MTSSHVESLTPRLEANNKGAEQRKGCDAQLRDTTTSLDGYARGRSRFRVVNDLVTIWLMS